MCEVEVTHREEFLLGKPGTHWSPMPHRAECDRWCMNGGIRRNDYASLREAINASHGHTEHATGRRICPDCGEVNEP